MMAHKDEIKKLENKVKYLKKIIEKLRIDEVNAELLDAFNQAGYSIPEIISLMTTNEIPEITETTEESDYPYLVIKNETYKVIPSASENTVIQSIQGYSRDKFHGEFNKSYNAKLCTKNYIYEFECIVISEMNGFYFESNGAPNIMEKL
jgi:hypothetical protein